MRIFDRGIWLKRLEILFSNENGKLIENRIFPLNLEFIFVTEPLTKILN